MEELCKHFRRSRVEVCVWRRVSRKGREYYLYELLLHNPKTGQVSHTFTDAQAALVVRTIRRARRWVLVRKGLPRALRWLLR